MKRLIAIAAVCLLAACGSHLNRVKHTYALAHETYRTAQDLIVAGCGSSNIPPNMCRHYLGINDEALAVAKAAREAIRLAEATDDAHRRDALLAEAEKLVERLKELVSRMKEAADAFGSDPSVAWQSETQRLERAIGGHA